MVYTIRELRALDIFSIDKMYDSLSDRSKLFLHLGYLGFESVGFSWLQIHVALFLSSITIIRKSLKHLCPYLVFLPLIVVDEKDCLIAFVFLKLKGRLKYDGWWGELVICVRDGYQRRGLGTELMQATINMARTQDVRKIFLTVLKVNVTATHFFSKWGFTKIRIVKRDVCYNKRRYENVEMCLDIDAAKFPMWH